MPARTPPVQSPTGRSIFIPLLRKELVEQVHGHRVHIGLLICVALCGLAALVRIADIRAAENERRQFLQRWVPSVEEQLERDENVQIDNTRAVSPLSVLSVGLEPTIPFRFASTKEGLRYGETRAARNTVDALFGYIDVAFVVTVILSLLAMALTFDSVCGERADGTLALLLSYPMARGTLLAAKILAPTIVLAGCFLPSMLLVLLMMRGFGVAFLDGWSIALYAGAVLLYVEFFVVSGTIVSMRVRRRPDAALAAILVWVLLVFAAPRFISLFVNGFRSPSRAVELALRQDAIESRLKVEYTRRQRVAFERYVEESRRGTPDIDAFRSAMEAAAAEMRLRRRTELAHLWSESDREEALRQRSIAALSVISPAAMFSNLAAELSWTGYAQRDHFFAQSRAWDGEVGRNLAESRQMFVSEPDEQGLGRAVMRRTNVRAYMSPFVPTWASRRDIFERTQLPFGALATSVTVLCVAAYALFRRMDPRA